MSKKNELFLRVYRALNAYYSEWSSAGSDRSGAVAEAEAKIKVAEQEAEKARVDFNEKRKRINAFLQMAITSGARRAENSYPRHYDAGALSKLALMMQTGNKVENATALYREATGQLAGVMQELQAIDATLAATKAKIRTSVDRFDQDSNAQRATAERKILSYLSDNDVGKLLHKMDVASEENPMDDLWNLGQVLEILPIPQTIRTKAGDILKRHYDPSNSQLRFPFTIDPCAGETVFIEYENEMENAVLGGMQSMIFQTIRDFAEDFTSIHFFDPIRYNPTGLGALAQLETGNDVLIRPIASSAKEINEQVNHILSEIAAESHDENEKKRLLVVHSFPQNYDSDTALQIRQLCANAEFYGLTILMTHPVSVQESASELIEFLKGISTCVTVSGGHFCIDSISGSGTVPFDFNPAPKFVPDTMFELYNSNRHVVDRSNEYGGRSGYEIPTCKKGIRRLTDIPYAVDDQGNVLTLDFENTNFATFICGASRSGKSTLLHTILTGIMKQNHPDDVEIWLIDFKMTEFSRYIEHTPPHVRYILLDESKELVYDIIDRLTEILRKRQNIFKGKWQKLAEVPAEKYMPAMFVVIDEFSVMSEILADSIMSGAENYTMKLQTLLAKGAALGMHFIFSSQGFTSGTRGLNDFSKKQIQQRIAMKTEFAEIRETLDLKSTSEDDRRMMEQLTVHHALTRVPVDALGNHLVSGHVLYISDNAEQEHMIDALNAGLTAVPKYDPNDPTVYIDKQTLIIDGNCFTPFSARRNMMRKRVAKDEEAIVGSKLMLFPGEPRRMLPLFPVELMNGYCENILLTGSLRDKDAITSMLLSLSGSAENQLVYTSVIADDRNSVFRMLRNTCGAAFKQEAVGMEAACARIRSLKDMIRAGIAPVSGHELIFLLGLERIMLDMAYMEEGDVPSASVGEPTFAALGEGELDLLQLMEMGAPVTPMQETQAEPAAVQSGSVYDAREDIKYILTQGSKLGYHFVAVFHTCMEFGQTKIDADLFKHKLSLRMPRMDISEIVGGREAGTISELADHMFRYTNGLDQISFRPYLHTGIVFDGWRITDEGVKCVGDDEDEYLL